MLNLGFLDHWRTKAGRLGFLALILSTLFTARAETRLIELPGRPRDSSEPWGAFLGKAAHQGIAIAYGNTHPGDKVFYNSVSCAFIIQRGELGNRAALEEYEEAICPDITNVTLRLVFEIKPDHEEGLKEGRDQVNRYEQALNRATTMGEKFKKGEDFAGFVFVHFGGGLHFWQLAWRTPEAGVTLYKWSRSRRPHKTLDEAITANDWQVLSKKDSQKQEELVQRVTEASLNKKPLPPEFGGILWVPTPCAPKEKPFEAYWNAATAEQVCHAN